MADEPRYADEIRIPISITLPWSGRLTRDGKPWPRDKLGRDWPRGRNGYPTFPIDLLPIGFAPGTSDIYRPAEPAHSLPEQFAAMDAAMRAEMRRTAAAMAVYRGTSQSSKPDEPQTMARVIGIAAPAGTPDDDEPAEQPEPPGISRGAPVLPTPDFTLGEETDPRLRKSTIAKAANSDTRGLERQLALHQQKLRDDVANPDGMDNNNFLTDALARASSAYYQAQNTDTGTADTRI